MRISQICPTCTTYINSLCIVYNGIYLSNINASPLDTLDKILANINSSVGVVNTSITTLNSSVTTINGNVALKENSSNKSTDGTFNAGVPSATLFPTQSAVATYVAANAPTLDQVLTAGAVSTTPLTIGNALITPTESSIIGSGIITIESALADTSTTYQSTGIIIDSIINTDQMIINFNKNNQTIDFPSITGTLALTSELPLYKSYVAVITQQLTTAPTVDYLLQNTLGGTVSFSYISPGKFEATTSSSLFTDQKTIVLATAGFMGAGPVIIGWERNADTIITITSKNASTGADQNSLIYRATIEIRVYP